MTFKDTFVHGVPAKDPSRPHFDMIFVTLIN